MDNKTNEKTERPTIEIHTHMIGEAKAIKRNVFFPQFFKKDTIRILRSCNSIEQIIIAITPHKAPAYNGIAGRI